MTTILKDHPSVSISFKAFALCREPVIEAITKDNPNFAAKFLRDRVIVDRGVYNQHAFWTSVCQYMYNDNRSH